MYSVYLTMVYIRSPGQAAHLERLSHVYLLNSMPNDNNEAIKKAAPAATTGYNDDADM